MKAYTLVTGSSSGLGKEIALECAKRKHNILLIALPDENLNKLSERISEQCNVDTDYLEIDLSEKDSAQAVFDWVCKKNYKVNTLINNAGVGGFDPLPVMPNEAITKIIGLNIYNTVWLTKLFIPMLKEFDTANILNIGSAGAHLPLPYKGVYSGSKAFISNFSLTLQAELSDTNIKVTVINPSAIASNDFQKEKIKKAGIMAKISSSSAEEMADICINTMYSKKVIFTPGVVNRILLFILKSLPTKTKIRIIQKVYKKDYQVTLDIRKKLRQNH